jgi:N-acetylneuraminic acid mutarotase
VKRRVDARLAALAAGLFLVIPEAAMLAADPSLVRLKWQHLPPLPDAEGFAGMFAGSCAGSLTIAGGANFTDKRPWEGGVKQWYDTVWQLESPEGPWRQVGRLPQPTAYGVSASTSQGLVCAGGGNGQKHFADVYRLAMRNGRLQLEQLPSLPQPCSFACGALVQGTLYILGGIEQPDATACLRTFWALDLQRPGTDWRVLEPCPGSQRNLGVAGAAGDDFYVFSGQRLSPDPPHRPAREFLRDAWRYRPGSGWRRLADLPRPAVGAPSPAPRMPDGRLLVMTGDDGTKITFKPETEHPGFPRDLLAYDPARDAWDVIGEVPFSRATVPTATWQDRVVVPNGEERPGYRSHDVWALVFPRQ